MDINALNFYLERYTDSLTTKEFERFYEEFSTWLEDNLVELLADGLIVVNTMTLYRGGRDPYRMSWSRNKHTALEFQEMNGGEVFSTKSPVLIFPIPEDMGWNTEEEVLVLPSNLTKLELL